MLYSLDVGSHVKEVEEATAASAASHHSSESKGDEQLVRQLRKPVEQLREESLATSRGIAELRQEKENERQELGRRMGALQQQHENEREELGRQIEALQQQNEFLVKELRQKQLQREQAIVEAVDTERLLEETDDGEVQLLLFMLPFLFSTILMKVEGTLASR